MRWTIKECSFVQRLDESERDSVLGFSRQPHIDPVLISNDWRSRIHFEGANLSVSGGARKRRPRVANPHYQNTKFLVRAFLPSLYTIKFAANSCIALCGSKKLSQLFMSAHEEPLFVAMRVLLALSAVVENGYD
jgi:hypothetical protein